MHTIIPITAISLSLGYLLFVLVRKGWNSFPLSLALVLISTAAIELFDLLALLHPENLLFWKKYSIAAESFLPGIWLWFTLTYARQDNLGSASLWQRILLFASPLFVASIFIFPLTSFFYSPDFSTEQILFLGNAGYVFYLLLLVYLIVPLVNLEMTLVSATHSARWRIKFELLGSGLLLSVMIFYYSNALLFHTINMALSPSRSFLFIVAVGMMAYSRLFRGNGVKVYVSQQVIYKSVVLLAIGGYLIGLGLMGEGMKFYGGQFHKTMLVAIAFVGGLGLIVIFLSESVRRRIKVFIQKNFYRNKYDYRSQWLLFTDRISSPKSKKELFQSIVTGFCDTFGMGCGALFLLNNEKNMFRQYAEISIDPDSLSIDVNDPMIEFIAANGCENGSAKDFPEIGNNDVKGFFSHYKITFGIPLIMNEQMGGVIILGRPLNPDEIYNFEDFDLMKTLARQASSALLNLSLSEQLSRSRELAAVGKVSTFVIHDLKNLVSALSLMLDNARDYINDPEFQNDMLHSIGSTVDNMNSMISKLRHLPEKTELHRTPVDLLQLAHETASLIKRGNIQVSGNPVVAAVDREEIQKVALNLMLNAVEASNNNNPVKVEVGMDESPFLKVSDEGCGISEEFIMDGLFTPFRSTKSKGLGIGLYQCKKIVEAHGGNIKVMSELQKGSEFTVLLPGEG